MKKMYLPALIGLCALISLLILLLAPKFPEYDMIGLLGANILLGGVNAISFFLLQKKLKEERAQAFVNGVYSATLLRLMVCLAGIFIYAYSNREHLHKPTVFVMMGFYLLYAALEAVVASREAKNS
jgi:predicted tellurium resistance membrane protein TerC